MAEAGDVKRLLELRGWTQSDLAEVLNGALNRNYKSGTISAWVNGKRTIPGPAGAAVDQLLLDSILTSDDDTLPPAPGDGPPPLEPDDRGESPETAADKPPGPGAAAAPGPGAVLVHARSQYQRAATDLWEVVAAIVGTAGSIIGNDALIVDGQIIDEDKVKLGEAWGNLAEKNDVVRKWVMAMSEGSAATQAAMVTAKTAAKMIQAHSEIRRELDERQRLEDERLRAAS